MKELFCGAIKKMKENNLAIDSLIITKNGICFEHIFTNNKAKNLRSISKTVTSLALGIALEKGYFKDGLETKIMKYFADAKITNSENFTYLQKIKIKHLATLTAGYNEQILNESHLKTLAKGDDLAEFALNYPLKYSPGEYFQYCNAPIYLLSIILEKETGEKLASFVNENIFCKLGIKNFRWLESEQGFAMGCTGLELSPTGLHKIGLMILQRGMFENEQIISENWLNEMTKIKVNTSNYCKENRALPKLGYGYNLWITNDNVFYHDGSNGQYLIISPNKNMIISVTAEQKEMGPITDCLREIIEV